jgi:rhamnose transport system ATP-binding protein
VIDGAQTTPALQAEHVSKAYGGVHALRDVSFDVRAGEVHALVGENGAGKSTLIRILTGATVPDEGEVRFRGELTGPLNPAIAKGLGIAAVYQQPALFPDLTVAENIAIASESMKAWRRVDWPERRRHAEKVLARVGASIRPDALVRSLTLPEQQLLDIARAVDENPAAIIFDEPTASLGPRETENLIRIVQELRERGTAVVYISHRFEELFRIADRVTVLRDGSRVGTFAMREVTAEQLIHLMIGRELAPRGDRAGREHGSPVLEVRGLGCRRSGLQNISLTLRRGEVLGLAGFVGAGRTQLAECIFGLVPADEGEIAIDGKSVHVSSPREAIALGLAYVPEDRRRHGVIAKFSVTWNVTLSSLRRLARFGFLRTDAELRLTQLYIDRLRIRTSSPGAPVNELSGGNQQKVVLARSLATEPRVLILDEPTQGVDIGAKAEIHALIDTLSAQGIGILLISSDLPEILQWSDRIAVMKNGRIAGLLEGEQMNAANVMRLALPDAVAAA